jgi:hypothetical protein
MAAEPQPKKAGGPLRLEQDPPTTPEWARRPDGGAFFRYFACAFKAANSASLRSVMTPISLAR